MYSSHKKTATYRLLTVQMDCLCVNVICSAVCVNWLCVLCVFVCLWVDTHTAVLWRTYGSMECVCVCVHVCNVCVCVCACIYVCMYVCTYVCII